MKTLQGAAGVLGIEGPGLNVVGAEIIKQGARNRGLADPALVRAHYNHCRLCHVCSLSAFGRRMAAGESHTCPTRRWQKQGRIQIVGINPACVVNTLTQRSKSLRRREREASRPSA